MNYYTIALEIADSLEFYKDKRDCYYNLAYTNEKLQFYKQAYMYLNRFIQINDTLYNNEINERVLRMQMRFDLKTKEREIEIIRQKEKQRIKERNFMFIGILFLLIILILTYLFRMRQKIQKKLKLQYNEIKKKQDELNAAIEQLNQVNYELKKTNDQITYSLIYASYLQQMLIPFESQFKIHFTNSFILNQPKNIVSGDFAWIYETAEDYYFAIADCTGHGLAGALASIKGTILLNNFMLSTPNALPSEILNWLQHNWNPIRTIGSNNEDSLEISLFRLNKKSFILDFSTTNQRFVVIDKNGNGQSYSNNIFCIDGTSNINNAELKFNNDQINIQKGDTLYLFTDGFLDQFGHGNQKLMFNAFLEQLKSLAKHPIQNQAEILKEFFINWKGEQQQTDDVLVIGIRF